MIYARVMRVLILGTMVLSMFGPGAGQAGAAPMVFVVNSKVDGADAQEGDQICADATGKCTLRAAITEANLRPGLDKIKFKLGGPNWGIRTIVIVNGPLPIIYDQVYIDATTHTYCDAPCVALDGHLLPDGSAAIEIETDNSRIRGLIIHSFAGYSVYINGDGNSFQKNYVGFIPGETSGHGNLAGMSITGSHNLIGGTTAEERNVISGNEFHAIVLNNNALVTTSGNIIRGNYIGTNAAGTAALPNAGGGIYLGQYPDNTIIGGTMAGARNVISGNGQIGIDDNSSRAIIQGNYMGTKANGKGSIPPGQTNIWIRENADGTLVGGLSGSAANKITGASMGAILVAVGATEIGILRNQIYGNAHTGIDLNGEWVTANDLDDPDIGANRLQNFPVITLAKSATQVIKGSLNSEASQNYRLEFFSSPAGTCADPAARMGKKFMGAMTVTTDAGGDVTFTFHSPRAFAAGSIITATATHVWGAGPTHYETSEFSECVPAG